MLCAILFHFRIFTAFDKFEWNIWLYGCKQCAFISFIIEKKKRRRRKGKKSRKKRIDAYKEEMPHEEKYSNKLSNTHGKWWKRRQYASHLIIILLYARISNPIAKGKMREYAYVLYLQPIQPHSVTVSFLHP